MESASSMSTGWYAARQAVGAESRTGPHAWEELYGLALSGALQPCDLVWHPSLPDWVTAMQIPGLFDRLSDDPLVGSPSTGGILTDTAVPAIARPYAPPKRRPWLLPVLIPIIALVVVGGGLGAYFAF